MAAPSSRSERGTDTAVPSSSKGKAKLIPPPYGPFSEDRGISRISTSQDMIDLARRPIIQPRRDSSLAPSTEVAGDVKAGHLKKHHVESAELCLVSRVPALLKAAHVLHGLREIIIDCNFEGDCSIPRFGSRDDMTRLKMREKESTWLMRGHAGWLREVQHLNIDV